MEVTYRLVRSNRRTISIQITAEDVVVRAPRYMTDEQIAEFVKRKESWIRSHLQNRPATKPAFPPEAISALTHQAQFVIPDKVAHYAKLVGVTYGNITIRHQRTRWGSCSAKGNLNFNCLLMLVPEKVLDYVIVHELCHRKEMNHSRQFWALVARVIPDWQEHRRWLRQYGNALVSRLPES